MMAFGFWVKRGRSLGTSLEGTKGPSGSAKSSATAVGFVGVGFVFGSRELGVNGPISKRENSNLAAKRTSTAAQGP